MVRLGQAGGPYGSVRSRTPGPGTLRSASPHGEILRGSAGDLSPPAPHARRSRAALAVALCVGAAAALSGCAKEDPDAGTNGIGKLTARQIEAKAQSSATAAKAVRLSGTLVSKGVSYKLNMRLKQDGAAGSVATRNSLLRAAAHRRPALHEGRGRVLAPGGELG